MFKVWMETALESDDPGMNEARARRFWPWIEPDQGCGIPKNSGHEDGFLDREQYAYLEPLVFPSEICAL